MIKTNNCLNTVRKSFLGSVPKIALSKPVVDLNDVDYYKDKSNCKIDANEIVNYMAFPMEDALSISVVHGYLGGPDIYYACNIDNSSKCYAVCREEVL